MFALEGIDKSGKSTQALLLRNWLARLGFEVELISFPDYSTPIGREIEAFLRGERSFPVEVRQLLYAANRWERKSDIVKWLSMGRVVIADRYSPSGLAYGMANGLALKWMLCLEEGLPKADVVIVIDVSVETAISRIERGGDVYERDEGFLRRVRSCYLDLARRFGWHVVDGERPIEDVFSDVRSIVESFISRRLLR